MLVFVIFFPLGIGGLAAVCDCGTPWTFLLTFFKEHNNISNGAYTDLECVSKHMRGQFVHSEVACGSSRLGAATLLSYRMVIK